MSFYVTLPSNSNMEAYPDNKGGSFVVVLRDPIYLGPMWEMGLAEIIFHRDWVNVPLDENSIKLEYCTGWPLDYEKNRQAIRKDYLRAPKIGDVSLAYTWDFVPPLPKSPVWRNSKAYSFTTTSSQASLASQLESLFLESLKAITNEYPIDIKMTSDPSKDTLLFTTVWKGGVKPPGFIPDLLTFTLPEPVVKLFDLSNNMIIMEIGGKPTTFYYGEFRKSYPHYNALNNVKAVTKTIRIPPKRYTSVTDFIEALRESIKSVSLDPQTEGSINIGLMNESKSKEEFTQKATIVFTPGKESKNFWKIHISYALGNILGLNETNVIYDGQNGNYVLLPKQWRHLDKPPFTEPPSAPSKRAHYMFVGEKSASVERGIDELWVYTDIIEPQIMGPKYDQLLRIVPVRGEPFGEGIVVRYATPHYKNLSLSNIQEIQVWIMPFYGGHFVDFQQPVTLNLHFRRKV